ncbi:hypothetical protein KC19_9G145100 [Ceratodon purpureus]|uniref:Uncharacterized protein n=1 Tax=Ceratodon purpureus TaxID=3225 RepID=A0A8T0GV34_CERPU|nr:hypothetical protein KC19_9G145100 [Ceratodon purpureus]
MEELNGSRAGWVSIAVGTTYLTFTEQGHHQIRIYHGATTHPAKRENQKLESNLQQSIQNRASPGEICALRGQSLVSRILTLYGPAKLCKSFPYLARLEYEVIDPILHSWNMSGLDTRHLRRWQVCSGMKKGVRKIESNPDGQITETATSTT